MSSEAAVELDRERTAGRLLRSTATRSYDPEIDIDWSAPLAEGKAFLLEHRCSLYGTPLWEQLTPAQRLELGKHEAISVASTGIWLECVLMRLLSKVAYHGDPASRHVQYAMAELAEECRHTTMFARLIERLGVQPYRPSPVIHRLGAMLPAVAHGPVMWGAILIGEELTDRYQREQVNDESVQPLMRMVNRIHIMEEARHISFARAELLRSASALPRWQLPQQRLLLGHIAYVVTRNLINPGVYAAAGLDPKQARRAAFANPHFRETIRYGGAKIVPFLSEAGLIGPPATHWWRQSLLLP